MRAAMDLWTNATAYVVGVLTWYPLTLYATRDRTLRMLHRATISRPVMIGGALLAGAALLLGFGLQQASYQASEQARAECYEMWGQRMVATVDASRSITRELDEARAGLVRAESRRDDALDQLVLAVTVIRDVPPGVTERELDRLLDRFEQARAVRDTAAADVEDAVREAQVSRARTPFPRLDCST